MKKRDSLPDGELEIMQQVWDLEPPVARCEIERRLAEAGRLRKPSTITTFLTRLNERGFLDVEHRGKTNYYTPRIMRREYLAQESRSVLDRLCGGSLSMFAAALCDGGVSREELDELRRLLEEGKL